MKNLKGTNAGGLSSNGETLTEGRTQEECFLWFHNSFPELRGLLCYNLNNSKNKIDGNLNKAKGLQPGRADFSFYFDGKTIFIEMKTESGTQSQAQREWEKLIRSQGFDYHIKRNLEEFKELIIKTICR